SGALAGVATAVAKMVVRDGEGASRVATLIVRGARSSEEAKRVATAVMTSPLVKTALGGGEPNWGRVMAAVGRSGAGVHPERIDMWIGGVPVVRNGIAASPDLAAAADAMRGAEVEMQLDLHLGSGRASGVGRADGDTVIDDLVRLKGAGVDPVLVHGGGPEITRMLERLGKASRFIDGLRVTDEETMEVVEMVLAGRANKQLVSL